MNYGLRILDAFFVMLHTLFHMPYSFHNNSDVQSVIPRLKKSAGTNIVDVPDSYGMSTSPQLFCLLPLQNFVPINQLT